MDISLSSYTPRTKQNRNKLHNHLDFLMERLANDHTVENVIDAIKFVRMVKKSEDANHSLFHGDNKWFDYAKLAGLLQRIDMKIEIQCREEYPEWFI